MEGDIIRRCCIALCAGLWRERARAASRGASGRRGLVRGPARHGGQRGAADVSAFPAMCGDKSPSNFLQPPTSYMAPARRSPSLSRSSAAPYTHQQSFGSTAGPAVPTPAAAAAASANASQSRTFNRHLYNTAGAYSGSAAPAPASPGTAMPGAGGWGAHVPSPPPAPAPAPGPQMQAGGGGGWGAGAGYGSAAGVQGAMAVPMSGVVGGAPGAGSAYGGAGGAAHGAAPAIMVPGDGSAGQMETTPAARQGPPPGMTLR